MAKEAYSSKRNSSIWVVLGHARNGGRAFAQSSSHTNARTDASRVLDMERVRHSKDEALSSGIHREGRLGSLKHVLAIMYCEHGYG